MLRLLIAAMVLAGLLAQPAFAQGRKPFHAMTDEEKAGVKASEAVDRQYRNALDKTRKDATEIQLDPWSNMRGGETTPPKKK